MKTPQWISEDKNFVNDMDFEDYENFPIADFIEVMSSSDLCFIAKKTLFDVEYEGDSEEIREIIEKWNEFNESNNLGGRGIYTTLARIGEAAKIPDVRYQKNESRGNIARERSLQFAVQIVDHLKRYDSKFGVNFQLSGYPDKNEIKRLNKNPDKKAQDSLNTNNSADSIFSINSLNIILEGVAGCGKTYYLEQILSNQNSSENDRLTFSPENSEVVVFHPSTSYEDFVSGLRPQKGSSFKGQAGVFVDLCNRAADNSDENFLLFIDEINRANTAKVFGDLLMVIEESKRTSADDLNEYRRAVLTRDEAKELTHSVRLQTPVEIGEEEYEYLAVPDNLYIIGTMNSTDRSVGTIDLALRRRFTWQTMEPMTADELTEALGEDSVQLSEVISWYKEANEKLEDEVGPDARLGHSYFFGGKTAKQVSHDLLKQLAEIADMFHLEDLMDAEPFNRSVKGRKVIVKGKGLGRRPIVVQAEDTAQSAESEPANEPNVDSAGE